MSGLPDRPDLDQLRRQARELLRAAAAGEPRAADRLRVVSPRVRLSAAQLALAREYGFPSWAALKAEVARRRSPATPADRWSFGGAAVLQTPAGVLLPELLIADAEQAILHGSLTLPGHGHLAAADPGRRAAGPGALLARLLGPHGNARAARGRRAEADEAIAGMRAILASVTIVDDRGTRYAFRGGGSSGRSGAPDRIVRLNVEPVPGRETGWIELHAPDGATVRLLAASRAAARTGQPGPARANPVRVPGAAPGADGPRLHRDIGLALPAVDGVSIHLDALVSLPGSWQLYLRARPRWRSGDQAGQLKDRVLVRAEDDRGGIYLGSYARNTHHSTEQELAEERIRPEEELALQFLPRLDPRARAVRVTFQGAREEIAVDLDIGTA